MISTAEDIKRRYTAVKTEMASLERRKSKKIRQRDQLEKLLPPPPPGSASDDDSSDEIVTPTRAPTTRNPTRTPTTRNPKRTPTRPVAPTLNSEDDSDDSIDPELQKLQERLVPRKRKVSDVVTMEEFSEDSDN